MVSTLYNRRDSEINLSDDDFDYSPLQDTSYRSREKEKETETWDIFRDLPPEDETLAYEDALLYQYTIKFLKILTYIVVFVVVLASGVVAKMTILLMTSQLKHNIKRPICSDIPRRYKEVEIPLEERIQWTWAILFCFLVPEVGTLLRSLRIVIFKSRPRPTFVQFIVPCFFEVCHAIGLSLFTFCVLPEVHVVKGAMMGSSTALIPGILALMSRYPKKSNKSWFLMYVVDGLAIVAQIYGLILWPYLSSKHRESEKSWLFPLSAVLISFGWWENYVSKNSQFQIIRALGMLRKNLERTRYQSYIYISILKMAAFFGTMCLSIWLMNDTPMDYFDNFKAAFNTTIMNVTIVGDTIANGVTVPSTIPELAVSIISQKIHWMENSYRAVQYAFLIQFLTAYMCYITAKFACKICIQGFSFSLPLSLSLPVTIAILVTMCGMRAENVCFAKDIFPHYLYWTCPKGDFASDFLSSEYGWIWILLLLSQTWIVIHIWYPRCPRLAPTEVLFCTPMYNAVLTDQDIVLNRKRYEHSNEALEEEKRLAAEVEAQVQVDKHDESTNRDTVPHIIACATMWHENKEEMISMFKSVFRMDEDQCARRVAVTYFDVADPGYYEFETHIFFDDAFQPKFPATAENPSPPPVINEYVRAMLNTVEEAASLVHETIIRLRPPKKIPTPYGGRLEYTLPGKTKLYVHLKNKDKIRHRKRWSQCMYMYYLLGHQIVDQGLPPKRQDVIAENTYLLALDGDIDFQPHAVELLVDLMKKNKNLGAACGRIHPIGDGPMVWYQKFEYAIGHWLQKATEHMIGCVLCSPGCFSLFRAKGLMADNVMAKYTTMSEEPRHYVQYDQGEDRWLCTLLLQQGWRVEYCAASDAYTNAPSGFNEFYNQRRRWVPSTMANILDLLMDYKRTIKVNPDISMPYIIYQFVLMGGSILGPGTIFLMLVGAFVAAFKIDNYMSFYINLSPLLLFIIVCYFCKAKTQLTLAKFLSVIYALVMVAVLLALVLQVVDDGLLAPSSIFLVAITISFIVAAFVHPLELSCLLHGVIYYITIPSMYLLLIIYSLFNLNDVTWGTREVKTLVSQAEQQTIAAAAAQAKGKKGKGFLSFIPGLTTSTDKDTDGSLDFSFAGLCRLSCCFTPKPKEDSTAVLFKIDESLQKLEKKLSTMEKTVVATESLKRNSQGSNGSITSIGNVAAAARSSKEFIIPSTPTEQLVTQIIVEEEEEEESDIVEPTKKKKSDERDDLMNPHWLEDPLLKHAETDFLPTIEIKFWTKMIGKYLYPIYEDDAKKKKLKQELKDLRNKVVGAFFMFNAVFVTAMFLLQLNKDKLFFEWPLGATYNMTYVADTATITVEAEYLHLEPLGLLFVGFYAIILVVQFIAMLFHRFGTFAHIMASTSIGFLNKNPDSVGDKATLASNSVKIIKIQGIKNANEDSDTGTLREGGAGRRKTIVDLHKSKNKKVRIHTLDRAFQKNLLQASNSPDKLRRMSRAAPNMEATLNTMFARRNTMILERRESLLDRSQAGTLVGRPGRLSTFGTTDGGILRRPRFADSVSDSAFDEMA